MASRWAAPARTAVRRSGAAMNAASKCDSWARRPSDSPRFRATSPPSGSSRPAAIRSSVVLPAPFGPTSPIRSPTAIAAVIESRMTNVPTSRRTSLRRRIDTSAPDRRPRRRPPGRRRAPGPLRPRLALGPLRRRQADTPLPGRQLRPAAAATRRPRHRREDPPGAGPIRGRESLAPRAEVRRPSPDDDPPDRVSVARTGLVGALVDLKVLLHLAVAVGRRVVVDRRTAPDHGLGEDPPQLRPEPPLVRRSQRPRRAERVEARRPERLVGVDVADAGHERLIEQERLQAALAPAQAAAERLDR